VKLYEQVQDLAGETWSALEPKHKALVCDTLADLENLLLSHMQGQDVEQELKEVQATFLNMSFVGASVVRDAVVQALAQAAEAFGFFLGGVVKGIVGAK